MHQSSYTVPCTRILSDESGALFCPHAVYHKAHRVRSMATTRMSVAGVSALAFASLHVCRCSGPFENRFSIGRLYLLRVDHFVMGCGPPVMYSTYGGHTPPGHLSSRPLHVQSLFRSLPVLRFHRNALAVYP